MYLRQIIDGAPRDPTMTYVRDLSAIKAGDWLRKSDHYHLVVGVRDAGFDNPLILWADTVLRNQAALDDLRRYYPDDAPVIHDLRDEEPETWRYGMMTQDGRMPTADEARRWMARTRS